MSAKFVLGSLIAAMAIALSGCDSEVAGPVANNGQDPATMTPAEIAKADDKEAQDMLQDKAHLAEAKDWLSPAHKNHMLWKGDRETITQLVNDLYDAGAPKVWAANINEAGANQIVAVFVVELPTEKDKRAKVFGVHNNFWKKSGADQEDLKDLLIAENGQKFIVLDFDD
jgi:hypothetical protein